MTKKIAELSITDTWKGKDLTSMLEKAGYVLTLDFDGTTEKDYIISEPMEEE